jgi:hypothetical protein
MSDFTIKALTPETFDDFAALVDRNKGMFASDCPTVAPSRASPTTDPRARATA